MIEQTKTKPQETLDFKMKKQLESFSSNPPINLIEEGKWLLGVASFERKKPVFNIANANNRFSITIPDHWNSQFAEKTIDELKKFNRA